MNITLILSGGTGTRLGADIPKQYIEIKDRPIISYCMERLAEHEQIDAIQIVAGRRRSFLCWASIMRRTGGFCQMTFLK